MFHFIAKYLLTPKYHKELFTLRKKLKERLTVSETKSNGDLIQSIFFVLGIKTFLLAFCCIPLLKTYREQLSETAGTITLYLIVSVTLYFVVLNLALRFTKKQITVASGEIDKRVDFSKKIYFAFSDKASLKELERYQISRKQQNYAAIVHTITTMTEKL